jgi:hypothetical protein
MVGPRYIGVFAFAAALWAGLALAVIWLQNPYGVSPFRFSIHNVNRLKPERIDIDRLIKPYEVWRYQPRSVFLGTSRIHQSIDPEVLDGTRYAPAYNAAVPANTLSENAAYIPQYFRLDPQLKFVFIELFLYNFIFPGPEEAPRGRLRAFADVAPLQFSGAALFDSLLTLQFNRSDQEIGPFIASGGYWVRPAHFDTKATFNAQLFADTIVRIHKTIPTMLLQPSTLASVDRIAETCMRHHAQLIMLLTPSYPWDDYRLRSLGYWPLLEQWLRRVAEYPNVYSFAQYNDLTDEPVSGEMKYWNDPIHFNMTMGRLMLRAFSGEKDAELPNNFMVALNRRTVEAVIENRRAGLDRWTAEHQRFAALFEAAKRAGHLGPFGEIKLGSR